MTLNLHSLDHKLVTAVIIHSPGTKFHHYEVIPFDEIYVPPMANNPVRKKGKNPHNVEKLAQSTSRGIQYDKMPPVVRKCSQIIDGKHYKYELVCGNHRMEAFIKNGYDRWIFGIYEFGLDGISYEDSVRTFQLIENDHSPALESSDEDISNVISRLISMGSNLVQNNEDSIREYVETYCKNKHWQTQAKIIRQAVRLSGAYQEVVTYTADDAFKWIAQNTNYAVAGEYDSKRRNFGYTVLEGYEKEYVMSASKKFAESGKQSYFICHTKPPTEKNGLSDKRNNMLQSFDDIEQSLVEVFNYYQKNGKFPWRVEGFLPQDHKANEKAFIPVV
jgi:hypothetical protein